MYGHERSLVQQMEDKPFAIIGVNSDRDMEKIRKVCETEDLSWRSFWNGPDGTRGPIAKRWNVSSWPTIYLLDHEGVIHAKNLRGAQLDA
ncbi:MAG: TlpA family protein disulfide reductase, partial [Planctomycetes bacterium]|nr:TlpA family protein disulfide reductase [Planctomycetota bacterium]